MKPAVPLLENEKERHNELFARANELLKGLAILDDKPQRNPGFFAKRKLRKAVQLFEQVLEIDPENWQTMFLIGKSFQGLGELEQALAWFLRAHDFVPEHPSVAKEVGYAAGRLGKHDVAVRVMEAVARQHPENAGLQFNLGLSCLMAGKVTEACKAFARTVELEPQRNLNRKLLALAREVETGKRPSPRTEAEILRAI